MLMGALVALNVYIEKYKDLRLMTSASTFKKLHKEEQIKSDVS